MRFRRNPRHVKLTVEQLQATIETAREQERRTLDSQARQDLIAVLTTQAGEIAELRATVQGLPDGFNLKVVHAAMSLNAEANRQIGIAQQQMAYLESEHPDLLVAAAARLAAFQLERPAEYAGLLENALTTDGENT